MVPRAALFVGAATGALLVGMPDRPGPDHAWRSGGKRKRHGRPERAEPDPPAGPRRACCREWPGLRALAAWCRQPIVRAFWSRNRKCRSRRSMSIPRTARQSLPPSKSAEPRVVLRPPQPKAAEPAPTMPPAGGAGAGGPSEHARRICTACPNRRWTPRPHRRFRVSSPRPRPSRKPRRQKPHRPRCLHRNRNRPSRPPRETSAPPAPAIASAPPPPPEVSPEPKDGPPSASASVPPPPTVAPPSTTIPSEAEPAPEKTQTASLTGGSGIVEPGLVTKVAFAADASKLPDDAKATLKGLVQKMGENAELRIQLLAYAGGPSLSSSKARRLSLSRALSVRSFLIESGMRSTRIDVRALGNKTEEEPVNRVDVKCRQAVISPRSPQRSCERSRR